MDNKFVVCWWVLMSQLRYRWLCACGVSYACSDSAVQAALTAIDCWIAAGTPYERQLRAVIWLQHWLLGPVRWFAQTRTFKEQKEQQDG